MKIIRSRIAKLAVICSIATCALAAPTSASAYSNYFYGGLYDGSFVNTQDGWQYARNNSVTHPSGVFSLTFFYEHTYSYSRMATCVGCGFGSTWTRSNPHNDVRSVKQCGNHSGGYRSNISCNYNVYA